VWHAHIKGPAGTPYEGGHFELLINFPEGACGHRSAGAGAEVQVQEQRRRCWQAAGCSALRVAWQDPGHTGLSPRAA